MKGALVYLDNKLLKKCAKYDIKVWCGSPVLFCTEEDLR
jgi:hypothetical protein